MGEVYKANDNRLHRTVAIKVLPEGVAADPALKQRFEREAKTVASWTTPTSARFMTLVARKGMNPLAWSI